MLPKHDIDTNIRIADIISSSLLSEIHDESENSYMNTMCMNQQTPRSHSFLSQGQTASCNNEINIHHIKKDSTTNTKRPSLREHLNKTFALKVFSSTTEEDRSVTSSSECDLNMLPAVGSFDNTINNGYTAGIPPPISLAKESSWAPSSSATMLPTRNSIFNRSNNRRTPPRPGQDQYPAQKRHSATSLTPAKSTSNNNNTVTGSRSISDPGCFSAFGKKRFNLSPVCHMDDSRLPPTAKLPPNLLRKNNPLHIYHQNIQKIEEEKLDAGSSRHSVNTYSSMNFDTESIASFSLQPTATTTRCSDNDDNTIQTTINDGSDGQITVDTGYVALEKTNNATSNKKSVLGSNHSNNSSLPRIIRPKKKKFLQPLEHVSLHSVGDELSSHCGDGFSSHCGDFLDDSFTEFGTEFGGEDDLTPSASADAITSTTVDKTESSSNDAKGNDDADNSVPMISESSTSTRSSSNDDSSAAEHEQGTRNPLDYKKCANILASINMPTNQISSIIINKEFDEIKRQMRQRGLVTGLSFLQVSHGVVTTKLVDLISDEI